jgi:hypothetical protein
MDGFYGALARRIRQDTEPDRACCVSRGRCFSYSRREHLWLKEDVP